MTTPVQRCAATKRKLAGKEFAALTRCDAKAVGKGVAVDPTCESKAMTAFATAWGKAETHYVDKNGRALISSSERWAQDEGNPYGWESRVDECVPGN